MDVNGQQQLQVIKEYERVVIFRIGRLVFGGARGPGMIFVIPCIDTYRKIDLRYLVTHTIVFNYYFFSSTNCFQLFFDFIFYLKMLRTHKVFKEGKLISNN